MDKGKGGCDQESTKSLSISVITTPFSFLFIYCIITIIIIINLYNIFISSFFPFIITLIIIISSTPALRLPHVSDFLFFLFLLMSIMFLSLVHVTANLHINIINLIKVNLVFTYIQKCNGRSRERIVTLLYSIR